MSEAVRVGGSEEEKKPVEPEPIQRLNQYMFSRTFKKQKNVV